MTKVYLNTLFALIVICLTNNTFAQKDKPSEDQLFLKDGSKKNGTINFNEKKVIYEIKLSDQYGATNLYSALEVDSLRLENNELFVSKVLDENKTNEKPQLVQKLFQGEFDLLKSDGDYYFETSEGKIISLSEGSIPGTNLINKSDRKIRKYIGIISFLTKGECELVLKDQLNKITLKDQSLISYLINYHECKGVAYILNLNNKPRFKASLLVQAGATTSISKSKDNSLPTSQNLEKSIFPLFTIGTRISAYRESPRLSMDFLVGFSPQSNTINYFHENIRERVTGTSIYSNQVFSAQWYTNYSFVKSRSIDIYAGLGFNNRINISENEYSISDNYTKSSKITVIREAETVKITPVTFSPSAKLGAILLKSKNSRLSAELILDYTANKLNVNLPRSVYFYSINTGFVVGYSFLFKN